MLAAPLSDEITCRSLDVSRVYERISDGRSARHVDLKNEIALRKIADVHLGKLTTLQN